MVFVELPIFIRCADDLFSDEDLIELQNTLLENPDVGDLIQGARGLRKLRVPLPGRGKRGGARVIYRHRQFAYLIGVKPKTLQNWEQRRVRPAGPARALLKIVAANPGALAAIHA